MNLTQHNNVCDLHSGMAFLPSGFLTREQYFETALSFLGQYEWLYNWPVTEVLASGVLDQLPVDWWQTLRRLSIEELNQLPRGVSECEWDVERGAPVPCMYWNRKYLERRGVFLPRGFLPCQLPKPTRKVQTGTP